jgi:hypothetical protein
MARMWTGAAVDLLTKKNCTNVCLQRRCWYRWLPASWLQSFVFFGVFLCNISLAFIVATNCGYSNSTLRVSRNANFCDFRGVLFRESLVRVDRCLEESFLLAPCRRTHASLLKGAWWTIPCRRTRGRRSYLVSGTSFLPEKIWQWGAKKGYSFYSNFTRERWISRKLTRGKFLF